MTHATSPAADTFAPPGRRMAALVIDRSLPVYDPLKLMMLADETGDKTAQRFLTDYLGLLPHRQDRIIRELASGEAEKAMDAILSLKAASAMVGAVRLSSYCQYLQDELVLGNVVDRTKTSAVLAILAGAIIQAVSGN